MSEENNLNDSKQEKPKKVDFFSNIISGIKSGFDTLQKAVEEQAQKNKELWDKNKEKTKQFFEKAKVNWDNQIKKTQEDMQKSQDDNLILKKLKTDYDNWQDKVRSDFAAGIKEINKWSTRAYIRFLLYTIPVIIILIIVISLIGPYLPTP